MPRDPRYDILFEPIKIGPVTAKNRFFQVPHCNGMGHARPQSHAAMRGVKAEGGWAVVSTEEVEIHPTSDVAPFIEGRLWDDRDIPALELMTEAVHRHGALAAIELVHAGMNANNAYSREISIAPSHIANPASYMPVQARAMRKSDIRDFRRWHRNAALRARRAGFDIVYVYAGHGISLPMHFLQSRYNHRTDEYGGSLVNRVRLLRELIEDTKEAVGGDCAVAVRLAVDELLGADGIRRDGEGREIVEMLAELPDLWDVNVSDWANDSKTSRFAPEGFQEEFVRFVKSVTTKPVVGVGRFTSPDTMVSQIRRGVLDFIGAARPSIADPFLPRKIETGDLDDIRECIGCNICVSGDYTMSPIRCTQNPTMGEEWRKGWHPETVPPGSGSGYVFDRRRGPDRSGMRPNTRTAGLFGSHRGSPRTVGRPCDAGSRPARLGVVDQGEGLPHQPTAEDEQRRDAPRQPGDRRRDDRIRRNPRGARDRRPLAPGRRGPCQHCTGPWLRCRRGPRADSRRLAGWAHGSKSGRRIRRRPLLPGFASWRKSCGRRGNDVTIVTPADRAAAWTVNTLEQHAIQRRLLELGVGLVMSHRVVEYEGDRVVIECTYTARQSTIPAASVVTVTSRLPNDELYEAL